MLNVLCGNYISSENLHPKLPKIQTMGTGENVSKNLLRYKKSLLFQKIMAKLDIRTLTNKYKSWEKLFVYEENYLWKKLVEKADDTFSRYIRTRDRWNDCITSGVDSCSHKIENACHKIPRWRYSHRWNENNVYGGCISCNAYHPQEHWSEFERVLIKKFGIDWVEEQDRIKNKIPPTIDELLAIIEKYTFKRKLLHK